MKCSVAVGGGNGEWISTFTFLNEYIYIYTCRRETLLCVGRCGDTPGLRGGGGEDARGDEELLWPRMRCLGSCPAQDARDVTIGAGHVQGTR